MATGLSLFISDERTEVTYFGPFFIVIKADPLDEIIGRMFAGYL